MKLLGITTNLDSGVLKIYSACETGLAPGKSVKVNACAVLRALNAEATVVTNAFWYPILPSYPNIYTHCTFLPHMNTQLYLATPMYILN